MKSKRVILLTIVFSLILVLSYILYGSFRYVETLAARTANDSQIKGNIDWKKIPRKPSPRPEDMHDKWIVMTTVSSPTEDVKKLSKIEGWKVVVVGDTKTPEDWR